MAITWRDIAAPDFRSSAQIASTANDAIQSSFNNIGSIFDRAGERFVTNDTNAAIKAAMGLNNLDTLDADRANIMANAGRDVDPLKLAAAIQAQEKGMFERGRYSQETRANDQTYTIGNQTIDANTAAALRKLTTNQQEDATHNQTIDLGKATLGIKHGELANQPALFGQQAAESRANVNQSNASAGASSANARLSNQQYNIGETKLKNDAILNSSADNVVTIFLRKTKEANESDGKIPPPTWTDMIAYVSRDPSVSGENKSAVLSRADSILGISAQKENDAKEAEKAVKKLAAIEAAKTQAKKEAMEVVAGLDPNSSMTSSVYDIARAEKLAAGYMRMLDAGIPVVDAKLALSNAYKTAGGLFATNADNAITKIDEVIALHQLKSLKDTPSNTVKDTRNTALDVFSRK